MYRGSIIGTGNVDDLLAEPRHTYLRELAQIRA
jgi:ABC-type oligopeptide transport system ATPase subunit